MAPKLKKMRWGHSSTSFILVFLTCVSVVNANSGDCIKPRCYKFSLDFKGPVKVPDGKSENDTSKNWTVFCFEGLRQSVAYLWTSPVLRVKRNTTGETGHGKFLTYFGTSVADVEKKRDQSGVALLQNILASMNSLQPNSEFSLAAFNRSCVGIDTENRYTAVVAVKVVNLWFVAYLILGIVLFFSAKSWSHNVGLHYSTGVSVGVMASLIILLYVMSRFLPQKLKSIGYILMLIGSSTSLWILTRASELLTDPVADKLLEYWQFILCYCVVMGAISFAVVYRYGPVTDSRTLNLIQWLLQVIGLVLVYNGTQIREISFAVMIIMLTIYFFPRKVFFNQASMNLWYRLFPPKVKLLTETEFLEQADVETRKALEELREYCRSPECQTWKVVSRLKDPRRFADFVEGDSWHVTNDEILEYDSGPDPTASHLITDSGEDDSEIDFILGSQ